MNIFKTHEIEYTPSTMFKRHYIDEIEYPPSPICGENPQFESNVTSFQFRQNASDFLRVPVDFNLGEIFVKFFSNLNFNSGEIFVIFFQIFGQ